MHVLISFKTTQATYRTFGMILVKWGVSATVKLVYLGHLLFHISTGGQLNKMCARMIDLSTDTVEISKVMSRNT